MTQYIERVAGGRSALSETDSEALLKMKCVSLEWVAQGTCGKANSSDM